MNTTKKLSGPVDFAIVTALSVELDAARSRLDSYETIQEDGDPHTYYYGYINIPGGNENYTVVVVKLLGPGNVEAAVTTARLIPRWQPASIIMVGVGGGRKGKVELGSVVVAEVCHYYQLAKLTSEGRQERPKQFPANRLLLGRAEAYEASEWRGNINVEYPSRKALETNQPSVSFAHIAAGEEVVADNETMPRLFKNNGKIMAVAMEGAGVGLALSDQDPSPRFLEVRGICDYANPSKNDKWHKFAANAAAAFVFGLLHTRPLSPLAHKEKVDSEVGLPLLVLRAQSLRSIGGGEVFEAFNDDFKKREVETLPLDFTDLVAHDALTDPEAAALRLANPQGVLFSALARRSEAELVFHGLAHIPLVVLAGHLVTDRQKVHLFDYHEGDWVWPDEQGEFPPLQVKGLPEKAFRKAGDVVIRVSVSYVVFALQTRAVVPDASIEIDLSVPSPKRGIVRSEEQVRDYGRTFREVLDAIARFAPADRRVHLFYSGPVALAFHLGQMISANIHRPVTTWNYSAGYDWGIDLRAADVGDPCIVRPSNDSRKLTTNNVEDATASGA